MKAPEDMNQSSLARHGSDGLVPALRRLDQLLSRAVTAAEVIYGSQAMADRFRGLHISPEEVEQLLCRDPGSPLLWTHTDEDSEPIDAVKGKASRFAWLQQAFSLSQFDLNVILIALAPELDLRYERLYAYLQDDVTRKRPSVDLALNLLCASAGEKIKYRGRFATDAPLISHRLVHLISEPHQNQPPLLAQTLKLDDQIVRLLLEQESLDPRLAPYCLLLVPAVSLDSVPLPDEIKQTALALVIEARKVQRPLRLYLCGPHGVGYRQMAEGLAAEVDTRLLTLDLGYVASIAADDAAFFPLVCREAWFQNAILYIEGLDTVRTDERTVQYQRLLDTLVGDAGIVILAGALPWVPPGRGLEGVIPIVLSIPDYDHRRACWKRSLAENGITLSARNLNTLVDTFRLTSEQIADAVATAKNYAIGRVVGKTAITQKRIIADLYAAARAQSGHDLAKLAKKITPVPTWDDIVLPTDTVAQLREMCQRVEHRRRVLDEWGFDRKLSLGKGVNAFFAGSSGTGKTMATEVIANELGLDLYKIDLSGVVSKYIGETEKNLERIFNAAESANAILFFDEADALFGKRSEVHDSHDRYANIEIAYLLQKMEQYEGITILASNLSQNFDDAFVRRLAFTIYFPFPDETQRQQIWTRIWPEAVKLAPDVDVEFLAQQFKLSGGNIKNIALASAFLAAADGDVVTMDHLRHATVREYQKLGKTLSVRELNGAIELQT